MKKLLIIICLLAGLGVQAQFSKADLQAAGLTCSLCSKSINNALTVLPFVDKVITDIKTSSFNISFKPGTIPEVDAIRKAVEDAGFSVAKLSLTGSFNQLTVQNDAHIAIGGKTFHFVDVRSQTLNGEQTITLVDKNFLTAKAFKKYLKATSMECIKTGKAGSCCANGGLQAGTRIYHVTI
jgi:copper chaperone CopZ